MRYSHLYNYILVFYILFYSFNIYADSPRISSKKTQNKTNKSVISALFSPNKTMVSQGETIIYTDLSTTPDGTLITSWEWTFNGGVPSTFQGQNPPPVQYNEIGSFSVSLKITNTLSETSTKTYPDIITVVRGPDFEWITQNSGFTNMFRGINQISIVNNQVVWASAQDHNGYAINEMISTSDGGDTWQDMFMLSVPSNNRISNISAISYDTAYIAMYSSNNTIGDGGIYVTKNSGVAWEKQESALFSDSTSFPNFVHFFDKNNGVCMGDPTLGCFEIYTTQNGGLQWNRVPDTQIPQPLPNEYGYAGVFDFYNHNLWFGTSKGRIFKSNDMGNHWELMPSSPFSDISNISFSDENSGIAYFKEYNGSTLNAIYLKSTQNGGITWDSINTLHQQFYSACIEAIPNRPCMWISVGKNIGTSVNGSSYTIDFGQTWIKIDQGTQYTTCQFIDSLIGFAGGYNTSMGINGIYKWNYDPLSVPNIESNPFSFNVFPNPSHDFISIQFQSPLTFPLLIQIHDITGKTLVTKELKNEDDSHLMNINTSFLNHGIYILKIMVNNNSFTRKAIIN